MRHVDMTKSCWTARSWATEIKCWNYLAMASMKTQISQVSGKKEPLPSPSLIPNRGHVTLETGHLKHPKRALGRTISSFCLLKPFNVGLPSLKVHHPFFNHQKINWNFGVSNLNMWNIGNIWWSTASGWFRQRSIQRHCIVVRGVSSDIWKFQTNTCIRFLDIGIDMYSLKTAWDFVDCWQQCNQYRNVFFACFFVCV